MMNESSDLVSESMRTDTEIEYFIINFNSNAYSLFFLQAENLLLICLAIVRLYLN